MRILVTGAAGRLGSRLANILSAQGHAITGVDVVGDGVEHLDITDFAATRAFVTELNPDLVLHPAAWTDVDGCAREPEKAININGFGTQNVALAAAAAGAAILYVSSNEVFEGRNGGRPYREYDVTNPINPYGYSKWVGEQAIASINPRHYIVRTAWLFAHGGRNFIQAILGAAARKSLRVVTNEVANPTYNDDLADAIVQLITTERYGIYHFVNSGACSRLQFARYFLDKTGYQDVPIQPISSQQWPRPSTPPEYAPLDNLAGASIGVTLRPWQAAVDAFLEKEDLLV